MERLVGLVPSLMGREGSVSQVNVIEETISYIDALHRRIAERFGTAAPTLSQEQIEEAEHGSQSLEDTGDFASRLATISNKSREAASAMSYKTSDSDETILPIEQVSLNRNAEDISLDAGMSIISAKHSEQTAGKQSETGEDSSQEDVPRSEGGKNQIKNEKDEEAEGTEEA